MSNWQAFFYKDTIIYDGLILIRESLEFRAFKGTQFTEFSLMASVWNYPFELRDKPQNIHPLKHNHTVWCN